MMMMGGVRYDLRLPSNAVPASSKPKPPCTQHARTAMPESRASEWSRRAQEQLEHEEDHHQSRRRRRGGPPPPHDVEEEGAQRRRLRPLPVWLAASVQQPHPQPQPQRHDAMDCLG